MKHLKLYFIILLGSIIFSGCSFNYGVFSPQKVFENKNFTWVPDSSQHVKYYFAPNSRAAKDIDLIKKEAERSVARNLSLIHEDDFTEKITLIFAESRKKMKELTGMESNGLANWKYNAVYYVYGDSLRVNGPHEFNHVITVNLWGKNECSNWLGEGFAVYSDDQWGRNNLHTLAKYFLDKNILISINDLQDNFRNYTDLITYPEAGSFVKYLYEKYGHEKIKKLWQCGEGEINNIYGRPVEELEKEWIEVIKGYDAGGIKYKI
jgi:hypothetical protein